MSQPPDKSKSSDNSNNPSSGQSSGGGGSSPSKSSDSQVGGTRPAQNDRSGSGGTVNPSTGKGGSKSSSGAPSSEKPSSKQGTSSTSKNASFQSNKFSTEKSKSKTSQGSNKSGAGSKATGAGSSSKNQGSSKASHESSKKSSNGSKTSGSSSKSSSSLKSNSKSSTTISSANKVKSQSNSKEANSKGSKKSTSNSAPKDNANQNALAQTAAAEQAEMDEIFAKDPKMVALFQHKHYKAIKLLGKGSFGRVFKVLKQDTDEFFAVKVVLLAKLPDDFKQTHLSSELMALMKVKHANVVCTVDIIRAGEMVFVTMEFCQNGDLGGYLNKRKGPIEEPLAQYWFTQIVKALAYMHKEHRMAHRDMKLNNILLDHKNDTKVADFGFAKSCWDSNKHHAILSTTCCGTAKYIAPQLHQRGTEYNPFMADVWAMGVLLFALLHMDWPFEKPEDTLPPTNVHPDYIKSRFKANLSKAVIDLCIRLMDPNERTRITLHQTLEHEWMAKPVSRKEAFANTSQKQ